MAHFLKYNDDEVSEGNTYYWKITKLLPGNVPIAEKEFKLHSMAWRHSAWIRDGSLYAFCRHVKCDIDYRFFEIRVGFIGDDLKEIVATNTQVCCPKELISTSQLHSILMTNKCLYLFVEIEKKDENGQKIKFRRQRIEADFKELLLSGRDSDVTIEVKHKKCPVMTLLVTGHKHKKCPMTCHRFILAARSVVFAAMFDQDMKEKNSGVVTIEDVEPGVFKEFLLFLYSGNDNHLSWKNVAELYKLADAHGMEDLKIACANDINENIMEHKENFVELFKLSRLLNDSILTEVLIQVFLKMSSEIVRREDWVSYMSENPVECSLVITALAEYSIKLTEQRENAHIPTFAELFTDS